MQPLISIIIPVYKVELYLAECLNSIVEQSIRNIEIILVDDGSPDFSGEIAEQYALSDNRIKVIHKENGGLSSARNAGLNVATGEYVAFIDSDDWIDKQMMELMSNSALKNNSDVVICGICVEFLNENKIDYCFVDDSVFERSRDDFGLFFSLLKTNCLFNYAWNKLYKRDLLITSFSRFRDLMPAEDLLFNFDVFKLANTISVVGECLYHYIRRDTVTILSSYHPNLLYIRKLVICETECFYNYFQLNGDSYERELSYLKVGYGKSVISFLYHEKSPFNRKERVRILSEEIYMNKMISDNLFFYSSKNVLDKLFLIIYKYFNPVFMDLSYSFLFFIRCHLSFLYYKFRYLMR